MNESHTNVISAMPHSYKLTDDAIKAVKSLVQSEVSHHLSTLPIEDMIFKRYQDQLDKYMMEQYPDLSNRLNSLSLVLDECSKNILKRLKEIENREKKLLRSESVYEDVYEIKDRLKKLDDFVCTFKSKLKKAFDL